MFPAKGKNSLNFFYGSGLNPSQNLRRVEMRSIS
jgi:hypothetical protein